MKFALILRIFYYKILKQRQVEQFDKIPEEHFKANKPAIQYFKEGHKGILTVENQAPYSKYTTYNKDYVIKSNYDPNGEPKGKFKS